MSKCSGVNKLGIEESIGQLLGYANASDGREDLYRQLVLAKMGKRELEYNDYWDSMGEYEDFIQYWRKHGDDSYVESYMNMRPGVEWLMSNKDEISQEVSQWQMLARFDSNSDVGLLINDADPVYIFAPKKCLAKGDFSELIGEVTQG